MDIDYQYERWLIDQAIEQCREGTDNGGYAANYLKYCGVCPRCYKDFPLEDECGNLECIEKEE